MRTSVKRLLWRLWLLLPIGIAGGWAGVARAETPDRDGLDWAQTIGASFADWRRYLADADDFDGDEQEGDYADEDADDSDDAEYADDDDDSDESEDEDAGDDAEYSEDEDAGDEDVDGDADSDDADDAADADDDEDTGDEDADEDADSEDDSGDAESDDDQNDADADDDDAADADDDADYEDDYEQAGEYEDDAIPTDVSLDPTRASWDVIEFEDDGNGMEDVDANTSDGMHESADMPTVRPRAARTPRDADQKDYLQSAGGRPIPDKGAPWQAEIYGPFPLERFPEKSRTGKALWQLQHYCGGSLIAPDWVLTAAHCIDQEMVNAGYRVRLGAEDISKPNAGMSFKIDRIVRHADFAGKPLPAYPNMYNNDIALIRIVDDGPARRRDPTQIRPIPLHRGTPVNGGTPVTGSGWGKTLPVEGNAPNAVLLKVDLKVLDQKKCAALPTYGAEKIPRTVFCAANPGRSTCQGDSGGPIVLTNGVPTLVGIISWGKKRCSGDQQPGVYTRVDSYLGWIDRAMKLDPSQNLLR